MRFYNLFPLWILSAILAASTIHPLFAQETLTPGHEERDVGISLYKQGNNESAILALSNAVKKDKFDAEAWYYLGLAFKVSGDAKGARKAFEQVVKLRPNFIEAHTGLSYSLLQLKKYKEAVAEAELALKVKPDQEVAQFVIGAVNLRENSYSAAARHAEAALKTKPNYPPALLLKSQALYRLYLTESPSPSTAAKRRELIREAASALEQYIRTQPNDKDIAVWREQLETIRTHTVDPRTYENVFKGSEVTTKAVVKSKPEPLYTQLAKSNGVTGTVILRAIFASDGTVRDIRAIQGLPDGLTETSIAAARKIKFVPATKDGKPVSMYIELQYNFNRF
jgi:TonB family protein